MTDHISDEFDFIVSIIEHADLKIDNVIFPDKIECGNSFVVSYDVVNEGSDAPCWGRILNIEDDDSLMEVVNTRWQEDIDRDQTKHFESTITMDTKDFQGRIQVGFTK